ncbi:MAG: hypothetical protein ACFCU4_00740 [Puniceicoccaceae bacterium]
MDFTSLDNAFKSRELFQDKTWRLSPEAFGLSEIQLRSIEEIGRACLEFVSAAERLYRRVADGRKLLRNGDLKVDWVLDYYDAGKPSGLIEHQRMTFQNGRIPRVLRPDLLLTEDGFALTELDSVPGGIGLTAFLNRLYAPDGGIIGDDDRMIRGFIDCLSDEFSNHHNPFIAIVVSDEAETYRPEMEWLAGELHRLGRRVFVYHPRDLMPIGESICVDVEGSPQRVDIIYRFFELFDLPNMALSSFLVEAVERGEVVLTPPMRPILEEKLSLALFHHPVLEPYWKEQLGKRSFGVLKKLIPYSWIVDPTPVGPNAFLHAPTVGGRSPARWEELANGTQKERNLILKISGFDESAWGARSVTLGSDVSREEWGRALIEATRSWPDAPYILQEYHKPIRQRHTLFSEDGAVLPTEGRVRLCPYFFIRDKDGGLESDLCGILATLCPADKKIIHGMKDAALLPCRLLESQNKPAMVVQ